MSKINNVSDVFREAKKYLWDGKGGCEINKSNEFICHAIQDVAKFSPLSIAVISQAKEIIQNRLGENNGGGRTVTDYLHDVLGLQYEDLTNAKVQQYRRDWLTVLEKEFAPKLKPKKGFYIYHIDGDLSNNELSNLTYVPNR